MLASFSSQGDRSSLDALKSGHDLGCLKDTKEKTKVRVSLLMQLVSLACIYICKNCIMYSNINVAYQCKMSKYLLQERHHLGLVLRKLRADLI